MFSPSNTPSILLISRAFWVTRRTVLASRSARGVAANSLTCAAEPPRRRVEVGRFVAQIAHLQCGSSNPNTCKGESMMTHTILRLPAVKMRTGLSRSTIYLRIAQGTFPKPVSLGGRAVGWVEAEVQDWLQRRIDASRCAPA